VSTELVQTIAEIRQRLEPFRSSRIIGLVPTMGALHAGHESLIQWARKEADCLVVSIFVNPLQFGPKEDYTHYPRTPEADLDFCRKLDVDLIFEPEVEEMYPTPSLTSVEVTRITDYLCGPFRPGHFSGVATVVAKLFQIIQPQRAYFGEKDAQQLRVIERMVSDLNLGVTVVAVPTVRESDGLAVSSRNQYLSPQERRVAPVLYRALQAAQQAIAEGVLDSGEVQKRALAVLEQDQSVTVEYLEIVDPEEMQPVERITGPVRVAGAIRIGAIRLIDNLLTAP
jgi:pantoate--beta-alanine ligase